MEGLAGGSLSNRNFEKQDGRITCHGIGEIFGDQHVDPVIVAAANEHGCRYVSAVQCWNNNMLNSAAKYLKERTGGDSRPRPGMSDVGKGGAISLMLVGDSLTSASVYPGELYKLFATDNNPNEILCMMVYGILIVFQKNNEIIYLKDYSIVAKLKYQKITLKGNSR